MDLLSFVNAADRIVVSAKIEGDSVYVLCVELKRKSEVIVRVDPGTYTLVSALRDLEEIAVRYNQGFDLQWRRYTTIADNSVYIYFTLVYAHYTTPIESAIALRDLVRASRDLRNTQLVGF